MTDGTTDSFLTRFVVAASYPGIMLLGFVLYAGLTGLGVSVTLASYGAIFVCAVLITLHELKLPYRETWKPQRTEIGTDTVFMVLVQVALPYLLTISLVVALASYLEAHGLFVHHVWPHEWPVVLQVILMLLVADFFRYWLHRAFHKVIAMWQFHAVHHSPHGLYWLNVGRFHPIEKAIQYAVDALPFTLLGVSVEVLAAYFVFYAINGFFQHSNCRVRLGPLNYLVAGPELHRWHHSVLPQESNNNYGNNLIIWDLLFGTRFLPKGREVGPLGLINRHYPTGFLTQLITPFHRGLDKA